MNRKIKLSHGNIPNLESLVYGNLPDRKPDETMGFVCVCALECSKFGWHCFNLLLEFVKTRVRERLIMSE